MNQFQKTIRLSKLYEDYLSIINGILHLSEREVQVFGQLLRIYEDPTNKQLLLCSNNKKSITKNTGVTADNIYHYTLKYKNLGILMENDKSEIIVNPSIIPIIDNDTIEIKVKINIIKDGNSSR